MWIVRLALRRPYTFVVFSVLLLILGVLASVVSSKDIVRLVDTMLSLNRHLACVKSRAQKATIERQIDATDAAIDRLVYELYGLTAEKIALIKISTSKSLLKKAAQRADEGGELDLEVPA